MKCRFLLALFFLAGLTACNVRYKSPVQPDFHPTATFTYTPSDSPTLVSPSTDTATLSPTASPTDTETLTETASHSSTDTPSLTPTLSYTSTYTDTPTDSPTYTESPTSTNSDTPTETLTYTESPVFATPTHTPTYTETSTPTLTRTRILTMTPYFTPCQTLGAIIFTSLRDGYGAIYTMDPDGSNQTPFIQADYYSQPRWSPDRSMIFDDNVIRTLTWSVQQVITVGLLNTWTPDGYLLATSQTGLRATFKSVLPDNSNPISLCSVETSWMSGGATQVGYATADWSPDRTKIAFSKPMTLWNDDIFIMDSDGSNLVNVTAEVNFWHDQSPVWSPDGTKIAYHRGSDVEAYIYVMNADGSGKTRLNTVRPGQFNLYPRWSPDGTQIVFYRWGTPGSWETNIFVIGSDGTGETQLTFDNRSQNPDWR